MKRWIVAIGVSWIAAAVGCASGTRHEVESELKAKLGPPALFESFEVPDVEDYTPFKAGQSFRTIENTWQVEAGGIGLYDASVREEVVPHDGRQLLELASEAGPGQISAPFATTPGRAYTLIFYFARDRRVDKEPARARVEVLAPKMLLQADFQSAAPQPFDSQALFSDRFVAESAETKLRFRALSPGHYGITIDAIEVREEVAKPGSSEAP